MLVDEEEQELLTAANRGATQVIAATDRFVKELQNRARLLEIYERFDTRSQMCVTLDDWLDVSQLRTNGNTGSAGGSVNDGADGHTAAEAESEFADANGNSDAVLHYKEHVKQYAIRFKVDPLSLLFLFEFSLFISCFRCISVSLASMLVLYQKV